MNKGNLKLLLGLAVLHLFPVPKVCEQHTLGHWALTKSQRGVSAAKAAWLSLGRKAVVLSGDSRRQPAYLCLLFGSFPTCLLMIAREVV